MEAAGRERVVALGVEVMGGAVLVADQLIDADRVAQGRPALGQVGGDAGDEQRTRAREGVQLHEVVLGRRGRARAAAGIRV